jgi:hypothetical protein
LLQEERKWQAKFLSQQFNLGNAQLCPTTFNPIEGDARTAQELSRLFLGPTSPGASFPNALSDLGSASGNVGFDRFVHFCSLRFDKCNKIDTIANSQN